jgi:hypothetical protein
VILVETPFCQKLKIFERGLRLFHYLSGDEGNFILFRTFLCNERVPLVTTRFRFLLNVEVFSLLIELLNGICFKVESLLFVGLSFFRKLVGVLKIFMIVDDFSHCNLL